MTKSILSCRLPIKSVHLELTQLEIRFASLASNVDYLLHTGQ